MDEGGETALEWTKGFRLRREPVLSQMSKRVDDIYQETGGIHPRHRTKVI